MYQILQILISWNHAVPPERKNIVISHNKFMVFDQFLSWLQGCYSYGPLPVISHKSVSHPIYAMITIDNPIYNHLELEKMVLTVKSSEQGCYNNF